MTWKIWFVLRKKHLTICSAELLLCYHHFFWSFTYCLPFKLHSWLADQCYCSKDVLLCSVFTTAQWCAMNVDVELLPPMDAAHTWQLRLEEAEFIAALCMSVKGSCMENEADSSFSARSRCAFPIGMILLTWWWNWPKTFGSSHSSQSPEARMLVWLKKFNSEFTSAILYVASCTWEE